MARSNYWWRDVRERLLYDFYNKNDYKDVLEEQSVPCSGLGKCEEYCEDEDMDDCELRLENIRNIQDGTM